MQNNIEVDKIELQIIDSMQKVFMTNKPLQCPELFQISALKGETISFQIAYRYTGFYSSSQMVVQAPKNPNLYLKTESLLSDLIHVKKVGYAPSTFPCYPEYDDDYLTTEPGLFPDVLEEIDETIAFIPHQWRSLWVEMDIPSTQTQGMFPVCFSFYDNENKKVKQCQIQIEIIDAVLPKQELIHTEWFYGDCLANYYKIPVFSEKFWEITKNFLQTAVKRGINMILTPLFTPPLDTLIGGERLTVQLIDVEFSDGKYTFLFDKFVQWVNLCNEIGIEYFEIAHLFSQWGAKYAPKIEANVNGKKQIIFGWNTKGNNLAYQVFLGTFIPEFLNKCKELGIDKKLYFHISDEPAEHNLETYKQAKDIVSNLLEGYPIIDALSNVKFYKTGLIKMPVPTNNSVHEFLKAGMEHPWVYYCSGQNMNVSNRYFAMPSYRNRILGIQMYKYKIEGFLHWGYNFYNSQYSKKPVNPYQITDAVDTFPSGDSFLVYPGEDYKAVESIRLLVLQEALQDMRAFKLLEKLTSYEDVMKIIERNVSEPITFFRYPKSSSYILRVREEINYEIKQNLKS